MFHYTYVLLSTKDKKFYVGFTKNLKKRFEDHCAGRVSSTKERRPLELVYYEASAHKSDAQKREQYLKTYHGRAYIRNRLKTYLTG